jgi:alpha-tubulin suppressor-like RCC1 family protein
MRRIVCILCLGSVAACVVPEQPRDNPFDPGVASPATLEVTREGSSALHVKADWAGLENHAKLAGMVFELRRRVLATACSQSGAELADCGSPEVLVSGALPGDRQIEWTDLLTALPPGQRQLTYELWSDARVWASRTEELPETDLDGDGALNDCNDLDATIGACAPGRPCDFSIGECACENPHYAGRNCDTCAERFSGADCSVCSPRFTGEDCRACANPAVTGTHCDRCVDPKFTGASCTECANPRATGASCEQCLPDYTGAGCGQCTDSSLTLCASGCVATPSDVNNCGSCGKKCAESFECRSGECACPGGRSLCGDQCVSFESREHCGSCGSSCDVACSADHQCVTVSQVVTGYDFSCARMSDGTVRCWGGNLQGQLGIGTWTGVSEPTQVPGLSGVVSLSAWGLNACAVLQDGTVRCWGDYGVILHDNGSMAPSSTPVAVSGITNAVSVSIGSRYACALLQDETVRCWGLNQRGQLGDGNVVLGYSQAVTVWGLTDAIAVSAGIEHACAVRRGGSVVCWGQNNSGELGDGTTTSSPKPVPVSNLATAVAIQASNHYTCALLDDGTGRCWGINSYGQLGDGTQTRSQTPVVVKDLTGAVALRATDSLTCALRQDHTVSCWGRNMSGNGGIAPAMGPTAQILGGLEGIADLDFSSEHACAMWTDGSLRCWGNNDFGQLGNGTTTDGGTSPEQGTTPVTVWGLSGVAELSAGLAHACARLQDGTVRCWGDNSGGRVGNGSTVTAIAPATVVGLTDVVSITATARSYAVLKDGTVRCWGIENGSALTPVAVNGIDHVKQFDSTGSNLCALLQDGTVRCWGNNNYGQVGNGTTDYALEPVVVTGLSDVVSLSASYVDRIYALLADGTVRCWGQNTGGECGDGTTTNALTPVTVTGLNGVVAVSAGFNHACAVLQNGTVYCWGGNSYKQLGNEELTDSNVPVLVKNVAGAVAIAAGFEHTCALLGDGTGRCWGRNDAGEVGNGTKGMYALPTVVSGLSDAVAISGKGRFTCATLKDSTVRCWGSNDSMELGALGFDPLAD